MSKAGNDFVDKLIDSLDISDEENAIKKKKLIENIEIPVKFAGIGQAGVGKTELLRSIFRIDGTDRSVISNLKTGSYKATTKDFYSFIIKNEFDLKIQFTDGPGLGEDMRLEEKYIDMWCDEIPSGLTHSKESELGFPFSARPASHGYAHRNIVYRFALGSQAA